MRRSGGSGVSLLSFLVTILMSLQGRAAEFDGKTVNLTFYEPNLSTVYTQAGGYTFSGVAPTTFNGVIGEFNVTVTDTNVLIKFFNGPFAFTCCVAYNGFVLTVEGSAPITAVKVNSATNVSGYALSSDASHIYVNFAGVQGDSSSVLSLDVSAGCQVDVSRFSQGDTTRGTGGYWGNTPYAFNATAKIRQNGCATTALSMSLVTSGLDTLPIGQASLPPLSQCPSAAGTGLQSTTPGTLNCFMVQQGYGADYTAGTGEDGNNVKFDATTRDVSRATYFQTGKLSYWDTSNAGDDSIADQAAAYADLDNALCGTTSLGGTTTPLAIVIGVRSTSHNEYPGHYVVVTGNTGMPDPHAPGRNIYSILDPGNASNTTLDSYLDPTSGLPEFLTIGSATDPVGDISGLDFAVGSKATLLVTDQSGNQTGFDPGSGRSMKLIPRSAYLSYGIDDDDPTGPEGTAIEHFVQVFQPSLGTYLVNLSGTTEGTDSLAVDAFSQDGNRQLSISVPLITAPGTSSTYRIQYSPLAGSAPSIETVATFQSTIADIDNSLHLGLIDNSGIANSLSRKIATAQNAEWDDQREILRSFINQVSAQSSKHITGVAIPVLLQDGNSLIAQIRRSKIK